MINKGLGAASFSEGSLIFRGEKKVGVPNRTGQGLPFDKGLVAFSGRQTGCYLGLVRDFLGHETNLGK